LVKRRNIPDGRQLIHTSIGADVGFWGLNVTQFLVPYFRNRIKITIRKLYTKLIKYFNSGKESQQITNFKRMIQTTNITKYIKIR